MLSILVGMFILSFVLFIAVEVGANLTADTLGWVLVGSMLLMIASEVGRWLIGVVSRITDALEELDRIKGA